MPGDRHEVVMKVVQDDPKVTAGLLELVGHRPRSVACTGAETRSCSVGSSGPTERRADGMVKLFYADGAEQIVICEMQNEWKKEKYYRLPGYMTRAFEDHRIPVELLVIASSDALARRYRRGIELGPGNTIAVRALGPGDFPDLTEPGELPDAPIAMLSAVLRGGAPPGKEEIFAANLDRVFGTMEPKRGFDYATYSFALLNKETTIFLEALMKTQSRPYHSEWSDSLREEGREKGREEGREEGAEKALQRVVLNLLETHAGEVAPGVRRRVKECRDESRLQAWIQELSTTHRVKDLEE